jgi:hypothetical protein
MVSWFLKIVSAFRLRTAVQNCVRSENRGRLPQKYRQETVDNPEAFQTWRKMPWWVWIEISHRKQKCLGMHIIDRNYLLIGESFTGDSWISAMHITLSNWNSFIGWGYRILWLHWMHIIDKNYLFIGDTFRGEKQVWQHLCQKQTNFRIMRNLQIRMILHKGKRVVIFKGVKCNRTHPTNKRKIWRRNSEIDFRICKSFGVWISKNGFSKITASERIISVCL